MGVIAIIDSGSTKSDWVLISENDKKEILRTKTIGLNPIYINEEDICREIENNKDLKLAAQDITEVYFYGAGTKSISVTNLSKALNLKFASAKICIESDIKAACLSVFSGNPAIVCILGTGSNSCLFKKGNIIEHTPSLGFILGDEGSGNHLGRMLLRDYFTHKMPSEIKNLFFKTYKLSKDTLIEKVYKNQFASAYLASFNKFILENKENDYIQQLIRKCFEDFFEYHILTYPQRYEVEINFVGSIAYCYKDILLKIAEQYKLKINKIIQKPIDGLVEYHKNYSFNASFQE